MDLAFDPEFLKNGFFYLSHSVRLGELGPWGQVSKPIQPDHRAMA